MAKRKANSTSWKPGQSGNPAGRPKRVQELRDALRDEELAEQAVAAMRRGVATGDIEWVALYLKHVLPAEKDVALVGSIDTTPAKPLTTEELRAIAERKVKP